ncbi:MAG: hypothetical protein KME19_08330 [Microcoleus vaginatus WJT46-NPBG5]|nr:hypothetical protein [Microcoleus vaginatus WJT46-NPBG5]
MLFFSVDHGHRFGTTDSGVAVASAKLNSQSEDAKDKENSPKSLAEQCRRVGLTLTDSITLNSKGNQAESVALRTTGCQKPS